MAKYKTGESGNPSGRPKGIQNKDKIELREWVKKFTEENAEKIEADFKELKSAERCMLYVKLLEYVLPKRRQEEVTVVSERERFMKSLFENKTEVEQ